MKGELDMGFYNISAEQSSLGSQLLENEAVINSIEILEPNDYYQTSHQLLFNEIKIMFKNGTGIDIVTLTEQLNNKNLLEKIGGTTYLFNLINSVPTPANIEYYNKIVKTKSNQRKILPIYNDMKDGRLEIDTGIQKITAIPQIEIKEETLKEIFINALSKSVKGTEYKFDIQILNRYLGGLDKAEILTIGGFTSQGKTSLAIQLAIDFAENDKKVLYISGEMTTYEVARRIIGNNNQKNIMDLRKGIISKKEEGDIEKIIDLASEWRLNIKKVTNLDDAEKYIRKYKPEIVFIDYLQNLGVENDYKEITKNMLRIHTIALREEITIIVLSQLSRGSKDLVRRPRLNDLRGSGRIEEISNMVILIYWENRIKEKIKERRGGEAPEKLELTIAKNRAGTIGRFELNFWPEYCRVKGIGTKEKKLKRWSQLLMMSGLNITDG
ncbi:Replicative DNA helicase [subsurface metagenome]